MIRFALFGAGFIGQVHGANIAACPRTKLQYVYDVNVEAANKLAGRFGAKVAGSVEAAHEVMAVWDDRDVIHAAFGVGLDYLFLLAYSTAIAIACVWGRRVFRHAWLVTLGGVLAWAAWVGGACDAVENVALLDMIRGPVESPAPEVAAAFAYVKFVLVYAGVIYGVAAALTRLARRAP